MSAPPRLPRKPEARTVKVEDLVDTVRRGQVRIPRFQRGLNWVSPDVVKLFDSIYRGYPIGSLLFYKRPANADRLAVGPLLVDAPETSEAWWVVDGQQRVTALAACLTRPVPLPARPSRQDPYVLYFDAESQRFEPPPVTGQIPSFWVPLPQLFDASQLNEWVYGWQHRADEELRRVVFDAGARIREYPIPLYLIGTEDSKVAEEIYYRVNKSGKPLAWTAVHKALFGGESPAPSTLEELSDDLAGVGMGRLDESRLQGSSPSTLQELSEDLMGAGMGRLDESRLLTCLLALRGLDPTRTLAEHYDKDSQVLSGAVAEALPILRRVLSFLRTDAGIPHLRLLPKSILLDVLTRFFLRNEDPSPRTRTLLARWYWRTVLGAGSFDDRTLRRRGIAAVSDDEEESIQELLRLVHKERPRSFELPEAFDARADESRIVLLALAHLGPRDLTSGEPIDIPGLLEQRDKDAFVKILKRSGLRGSRSAANRILHPSGVPILRLLKKRIPNYALIALFRSRRDEPGLDLLEPRAADDPILKSHAVDKQAAELLKAGDLDGFISQRSVSLTAEVRRFSERMAAWDHNDRPSIEYLLTEAGAEA